MIYTICEQSEYSLPTEILSAKDYFDVVPFFLYRAAPQNDTPLSYDLGTVLSDSVRSNLLHCLIYDKTDDFIFVNIPANHIEAIAALSLADQNLNPDRDKGFFQANAREENGTEAASAKKFDALIRHIRNSFAHGRTAKEGDFLILEDWSTTRKTPYLSARLVISPSTLIEWVAQIEKCVRANV